MKFLFPLSLFLLSSANKRDDGPDVLEVTEETEENLGDGQDEKVEQARKRVLQILGSLDTKDDKEFFGNVTEEWLAGNGTYMDSISEIDQTYLNGTLNNTFYNAKGEVEHYKLYLRGKGFPVTVVRKITGKILEKTGLNLGSLKKTAEGIVNGISGPDRSKLPDDAAGFGFASNAILKFFPELKQTMKEQYGTYAFLENHLTEIFKYIQKDVVPALLKDVKAVIANNIQPSKVPKKTEKKKKGIFKVMKDFIAAVCKFTKVMHKSEDVHVVEGHPDAIASSLKRRIVKGLPKSIWKLAPALVNFIFDIFADDIPEEAKKIVKILNVLHDALSKIREVVDFVMQRLLLSLTIHDARTAITNQTELVTDEAVFGKWFDKKVMFLPIVAAISIISPVVRSPFAFCDAMITEEEGAGKTRLITKDEYIKCSEYITFLTNGVPKYLNEYESKYKLKFLSRDTTYEVAINGARIGTIQPTMDAEQSYYNLVDKYTQYSIVHLSLERVTVKNAKWDGHFNQNGEFYGYVTNADHKKKAQGKESDSSKTSVSEEFSCPSSKVFNNGLCSTKSGETFIHNEALKSTSTYGKTWRTARYSPNDVMEIQYRSDLPPHERRVFLEIWDEDTWGYDDFAGRVPLDLEALLTFKGSKGSKDSYSGKAPLFNCGKKEKKIYSTDKFDATCGYAEFEVKRVKFADKEEATTKKPEARMLL